MPEPVFFTPLPALGTNRNGLESNIAVGSPNRILFVTVVFLVHSGAIFGGPDTATVYTAFHHQLQRQNNRSVFHLQINDAMVDMVDAVDVSRARQYPGFLVFLHKLVGHALRRQRLVRQRRCHSRFL